MLAFVAKAAVKAPRVRAGAANAVTRSGKVSTSRVAPKRLVKSGKRRMQVEYGVRRMYSTEVEGMEVPVSRTMQLQQLEKKAGELATQASKLNDGGQYVEAETALEGAMALRAKVHEELVKDGQAKPAELEWSLITAKLNAQLAFSKTALNKHEEALALYNKCLPVIETYQKTDRDRGVILMNYAECVNALGKPHDAIEEAKKALEILKTFHDDDELYASGLSNLSGYLCMVKKYGEAKAPAGQALNIFLRRLGKRNQYTKQAWNNYYCILKELGQDEEAMDLETDWRTQHEGPSPKNAEKLNDKQVEDIRRRLEERLYAKKRAEPTGSVKDPEFYKEELSEFFDGWKEAGFDLSDPAHETALRKELGALKRGEKHSKVAMERETSRIAAIARDRGEDWSAMLNELESIREQTQAVDDMLTDHRQAAAKLYAEEMATRPKTTPGPSSEFLQEIAELKAARAEKKRVKEAAEKAAAEAAAKAAAEAAAKGKKGKKR